MRIQIQLKITTEDGEVIDGAVSNDVGISGGAVLQELDVNGLGACCRIAA
jgi:hypothetical protein